MQHLVKGHSFQVVPIMVSLTCVSPLGWPGCGGRVTAQTPGDAAVGPLIVQHFLPPEWRPCGRQHREEDKQLLIWAPQAVSLFPSTPALMALGMAAWPRHCWAEDGQLVTPWAASCQEVRQGWGPRLGSPLAQGRDASGGDAGQWCQSGTVCPWGKQRAPALCQDQIRGLSWAAGAIR